MAKNNVNIASGTDPHRRVGGCWGGEVDAPIHWNFIQIVCEMNANNQFLKGLFDDDFKNTSVGKLQQNQQLHANSHLLTTS